MRLSGFSKKNKNVTLTLCSAIAVQLCNVIVSLVLPRALINVYGSDLNGILSAARQFSQYLSLMDTSITAATVYKFIELTKNDDFDGIRNLYVTIGRFYKKISIVVAAIAIVLAVGYGYASQSTVSSVTIIAIFFIYESIYVVSYYVFYKYNYILFAYGKQYYIAFSSVVTTIIGSALKLFLINKRIDIIPLICSTFAIDIIRLLVIRYKVIKDYPYLFEKQGQYDEQVLSQKWDSFIMSISDCLKSMVPVTCISVGFGTALVSVFSIYRTVMHLGNSIVTMCMNGILPVLGGTLTTQNERSSELFRRMSIVVASISSIICICICGMMMSFIDLYIGANADISYHYPLLSFLLILDTWLTLVRHPFDLVIKAYGKIRELRDGCIVEIIITISMCCIFSLMGKFELIMIGVICATAYRTLRMMYFCTKKINIDKNKPFFKDFIFWLIYTVAFSIVAYLCLPQRLDLLGFVLFSLLTLVVVLIITILIVLIIYKDFRLELFNKCHRLRIMRRR